MQFPSPSPHQRSALSRVHSVEYTNHHPLLHQFFSAASRCRSAREEGCSSRCAPNTRAVLAGFPGLRALDHIPHRHRTSARAYYGEDRCERAGSGFGQRCAPLRRSGAEPVELPWGFLGLKTSLESGFLFRPPLSYAEVALDEPLALLACPTTSSANDRPARPFFVFTGAEMWGRCFGRFSSRALGPMTGRLSV